MSIYWLLIFIVLLIFEIVTLSLVSIWFCAGAIVAVIASILGFNLQVQIILFIVVSIAALVITRPFVVKHINKNTKKTNLDSLEGEVARVTKKIDNSNAIGTVVLKGMEWTARSVDDSAVIPEDTLVRIVSLKGVTLFVEATENPVPTNS